ncbi:MAG TPA: hypothetical protein V6D03_00425 [Candidatus Caenarcaniphilales bacterium]
MDYLYYLGNASHTLRVFEHLRKNDNLSVDFITAVHQIDGWVVRVKLTHSLSPQQRGDFQAFMSELGIPYKPGIHLKMALWGLETGQSAMDVMHCYQVAIVSHGGPDETQMDIEAFRNHFIQGLGYCPETLA